MRDRSIGRSVVKSRGRTGGASVGMGWDGWTEGRKRERVGAGDNI